MINCQIDDILKLKNQDVVFINHNTGNGGTSCLNFLTGIKFETKIVNDKKI